MKMELKELAVLPAAFGKCEEKNLEVSVRSEIWDIPVHYCTVRFRKSRNWVQIFIPELIFNSKNGDPVSDFIEIKFEFERDEEKQKEMIKKWIGESTMHGLYGFSGCRVTDLNNTTEFIPLIAHLNENGYLLIYKNNAPLVSSEDGSPVGSVSTLLTLIPEPIDKEDGDEEPPSKKPKN